MTTSNPDLDTLIAEGSRFVINEVVGHEVVLMRRLVTALTDLRTERDAALAVIEKARKVIALPYPGQHWFSDLNRKADWHGRARSTREVLATAPMSALADRDARILEEAGDIAWHHIIELADTFFGDSSRLAIDAQATKAREATRAVSRRREASPQEGGAE